MPRKSLKSVVGSGNVFADLGFPNASEMLAKAELVRRINNIIEERKLTQIQAARILRASQPNISLLRAGRLTEFSLDRLLRYLVALGQEVKIEVRPALRPGLTVTRADAA
jgi:predicted XRE-type DNA-binding protein